MYNVFDVTRQSRIRRLYPRKLARKLAGATGTTRQELERLAEQEARLEIERQLDKGWKLATRLDTGEGVFVRDDDLVGLHIQLPGPLYRRLDVESAKRESTKRQMVIVALERYLQETS
jgi:hypothetical protein